MPFVPIKSNDQLVLQSLHRVRERWLMRRTAVINQMRGLLLERDITLRKGRCHVEAALPGFPTRKQLRLYTFAETTCHSYFSLATRRWTIHPTNPV